MGETAREERGRTATDRNKVKQDVRRCVGLTTRDREASLQTAPVVIRHQLA